MVESTLVLIKPDAVQAGQMGEILSVYETAGLQVEAMKLCWPSGSFYEIHYAEHRGKPFLSDLLTFMGEGPVVALILVGTNAVERVRGLNGATDPAQAAPDTIRGRFGTTKQRNCVHGSATGEDAEREVALWFPEWETLFTEAQD